MEHPKQRFAFLFIMLELLFFALFYFSQDSSIDGVLVFHLYIIIAPVIIVTLIFLIPQIKRITKKTFISKDMVIFISVLSLWIYIYAVKDIGISSIFSFLYYPVLLEELNFRFVVIEFLKHYTSEGKAVVIQAIMYMIFYSSFVIFYHAGYPGLYAPIFVLDNFAMAMIYGAIYYLRKNLYIPLSIHLSFYLLLVFLPLEFGWLGYVTTPV